MSFIRPEVQANLHRWREALIGGAVFVLGLWGSLSTFGITRWVFVVVLLAGAALIWEGFRRARFPSDDGGLGMVEVDERQITYLSPVGGGTISIEDLTRIEISTNNLGPAVPDFYWVFHDSTGQALMIPRNAEGTDQFFDVLTTLQGVDHEAITHASGRTDNAAFVIWEKPGSAGARVEYLRPRS